jgi:hypothetical protein
MFIQKEWITTIVRKLKIRFTKTVDFAEKPAQFEPSSLPKKSKVLGEFIKSENPKISDRPNKSATFQDNLPWPTLTPIQVNHSQTIPLKERMIPITLYNFSNNQAFRLNDASPEFVVSSVLTCASTLIGTSCNICPKEKDKEWRVTQAIWCVNIASPSTFKSPSTKVGVSLLKYAQRKVIEPNNIRRSANAKIKNQKADGLLTKAKSGLDNSQDEDSEKLFIESEKLKSEIPLQRDLYVNDATPEALLLHLESNPNGCLVVRDEIYGWLASQERSDNTAERALYTEAFEGSNGFIQKRVSRDKVVINAMHVGILGCIQPDRLLPLLAGRESGGSNDGFFERFQLAIFSESKMKYTDSAPDQGLQKKMEHIFCCLASLKENEITITANFSPTAQKIWNRWAKKQANVTVESQEKLQSVLGKYPSLVAKLSLLFHIMQEAETHQDIITFSPSKVVPAKPLKQAISFSKLLISHNKRIQALTSNTTEPLRILAEKLPKLPNEFSVRALQRKGWVNLKTSIQCEQALDELEKRGYVRSFLRGDDGMKKLKRYRINPALLKS